MNSNVNLVSSDGTRALELAVDVARRILECGGETYRAEELLIRTGLAAGSRDCDGFVIPTGVIASEGGGTNALVRRVEKRRIDLGEICRIEDLVRGFEAGNYSPEDFRRELDTSPSRANYSLTLRVAFAALIGAFFTALFDGTAADFAFALVIGPIALFLTALLSRAGIPPYFNNMLSAALVVFMALVAGTIHSEVGLEALTSGLLMLLVPGIAITNSVRDSIEGDLVAGVARGMEAFLLAAALAVGAGFALKCGEMAVRSAL